MKELEQAIRDLLKEIYEKEYTGRLKVTPIYGYLSCICGYRLDLALNKDERPLLIAFDGSECLFLDYLRKEFHSRNLAATEYFTAILLHPYNPPSGNCGCKKVTRVPVCSHACPPTEPVAEASTGYTILTDVNGVDLLDLDTKYMEVLEN